MHFPTLRDFLPLGVSPHFVILSHVRAVTSLEEIGLKLEDIGSVVEHIMKEVANPSYLADPRPWDEQIITQMLTDMWHDRPPSAYV